MWLWWVTLLIVYTRSRGRDLISLRDVAALATRLSQARATQKDIGSLEVLEGYYQQQLVDQSNTLIFSDSLTKFLLAPRVYRQ